MNMGLFIALLAPISFGLLGCVSKVAERKKCRASAIVLSLMGWSCAIMLVRSATQQAGYQIPARAAIAAFGFGIVGAVAFFAFQKSIEIGKVTPGWLAMNLSMGVPAIASIVLYHEKLTFLKLAAFALALVALLLIFWGRMREGDSARKAAQ
jgi:EamA domain-containing membrane protein RarD